MVAKGVSKRHSCLVTTAWTDVSKELATPRPWGVGMGGIQMGRAGQHTPLSCQAPSSIRPTAPGAAILISRRERGRAGSVATSCFRA